LGTLAVACVAAAVLTFDQSGGREHVRPARVVWTFEPTAPGRFDSSPAIDGGRVYVGADLSHGLSAAGAVFALDTGTGREAWRFDDGGALKPVFCPPCVADGRLYVGEGYHEDSGCRLFCLDAATGRKLWEFPTASHTESGPCVADGRV